MASTIPSFIAGLDPAQLLALGAEDRDLIDEARRTWTIQQDRRPELFRFMYDTPAFVQT